jgi:disulfide bond formation protein DsbB
MLFEVDLKNLSPLLSPTLLSVLLFVGAAGTLGGAWWFEHVEGYVPCKLCLQERWPYYFGIPASLVAFLAIMTKQRTAAMALLLLCAVLFVVGVGLGGYHTGVEWKYFLGPSDCGGGAELALDAGNLLGSIESTRLVSCNEASWWFLGLSFAGWNTVVSAGLVVLSLLAFGQLRRT